MAGQDLRGDRHLQPDFIWFDFGLDFLPEGYVKDFLAYYYNHAEANGKEVVVTYKTHDLVPGSGLLDHELGQEPRLTYHEWLTDPTVDDRGAWGYAHDLTFKSPGRVIDNLVDRVSKNGYLLLNVGPKADGTIPQGARVDGANYLVHPVSNPPAAVSDDFIWVISANSSKTNRERIGCDTDHWGHRGSRPPSSDSVHG